MKRLLGLLLCLAALLAIPAVAQAAVPTTTIYAANWGDDDTKIELSYLVDDPEATVECQIDEEPWYECGSEAYWWMGTWHVWFETEYPELTFGHWFRIRGTNGDGTEASPPGYYRE